jgi:hypothetical protein
LVSEKFFFSFLMSFQLSWVKFYKGVPSWASHSFTRAPLVIPFRVPVRPSQPPSRYQGHVPTVYHSARKSPTQTLPPFHGEERSIHWKSSIQASSVLKAINQKLHVVWIFCDLAKDSDCVDCEILLSKLHFYGIQGNAQTYLETVLQTENKKRKWKHLLQLQISSPTKQHGVPQGWILGPLLFTVYVNDHLSTIKTLSGSIIVTDNPSAIISNKNVDFYTLEYSVLSYISE